MLIGLHPSIFPLMLPSSSRPEIWLEFGLQDLLVEPRARLLTVAEILVPCHEINSSYVPANAADKRVKKGNFFHVTGSDMQLTAEKPDRQILHAQPKHIS